MSRIKFEKNGVNVFDKNDWPTMNEFLITYLPRFEKALQPAIDEMRG